MTTHFIAFRKRPHIRLEFVIQADTRQEAKRIAEQEVRILEGYTFAGAN